MKNPSSCFTVGISRHLTGLSARILVAVLACIIGVSAMNSRAALITFTSSGTTTSWYCPLGVTSASVQCWGGGGAGGAGDNDQSGSSRNEGGGGGGGAYAGSTLSVTPGNSYAIVAGAGGTYSGTGNGSQTTAGSSTFNSTTVVAVGGTNGTGEFNNTSGSAVSGAGGAGGSALACTGTIKFSGGNGENGITGGSSANAGGAGGSSAGTGANGVASSSTTGTGATAPSGGGNGGSGYFGGGAGAGTNGFAPGGGGGGANIATAAQNGGAGGAGQVTITYTAPTLTAWDFDAGGTVAAPDNSPLPSIGSGTATVLGMANSYNGTNSLAGADVTGESGASTGSGSYGWRVRGGSTVTGDGGNGWSTNAAIGTQGAQFSASTTGYGSIQVFFDLYFTSASAAKMQLQYTTDGSTWINASQLTYSPNPALIQAQSSSPNTVNGTFFWQTAGNAWYDQLTANFSGVPGVANNPNFGIRIVNAATGADDVQANGSIASTNSGNWQFDNVIFDGQACTITGAATATTFTTTYGTASAAQSFPVAGANLAASLVATAPTGYEVSTNSGTTYASTATFQTNSSGSVSGTLYLRLAATATVSGSYNSLNVVLSSAGATSVNIATASSGNTVSTAALTITGLTGADKVYDGTTTANFTGTPAYSGLVNGDSFSVSGTPGASFATATAGTGKTITVTGYTAPSANYTLTQPSLTANITPATPSFSLSSSENPSGYRDNLAFTANSFPAAATGSVQFTTNGVNLGGAVTINGASASSIGAAGLPRATTNIVAAIYSGDVNYLPLTNSLTQTVTNHPPVAANVAAVRPASSTTWKIAVSALVANVSDVDGDTISLTDVSASTNGVTPSISGGYVLYVNSNPVADQFTYTVSDGFGGTASALVNLGITTNAVTGQAQSITLAGGIATLQFTGIPGYNYTVERSTNLTDWVDIFTTNAPAGPFQVVDDLSANAPAQAYYRLRYNP